MDSNTIQLIEEKIKKFILVDYDENVTILNLGVDSIDFMRLIVELEEDLGIDFPIKVLSSYKDITPKSLTEIVLKELS